jgi:hypothetical protein
MSKKRSDERRQRAVAQGRVQHRFLIKLMRPIFQTTVITVAAATEERAVRLALNKAQSSKTIWSGDTRRVNISMTCRR